MIQDIEMERVVVTLLAFLESCYIGRNGVVGRLAVDVVFILEMQ
jgi:hypothetical protein